MPTSLPRGTKSSPLTIALLGVMALKVYLMIVSVTNQNLEGEIMHFSLGMIQLMCFLLQGVFQHKMLCFLTTPYRTRALPMSMWRGTKSGPLKMILQGDTAFMIHVMKVIVNNQILEGETEYLIKGENMCIMLQLFQGEFLHIMFIYLQTKQDRARGNQK